MNPSSLGWLVACICAVLLSALIFISRIAGWLEVNLFVMIAAGAAPLVTIYFLVQNVYRKPFERECFQSDWIVDGEDRKDIYVSLLASTHKQGRRPIIEILDFDSPYSSKLVESVVTDNGDIKFIHPKNHFMPMAPKEFKVRVLKG